LYLRLIIAVTAGVLLAIWENADPLVMTVLVLLFAVMTLNYEKKSEIAFVLFGLLGILYVVHYAINIRFAAQAMLLGILAGIRRNITKSQAKDGKIEIRRDVFQIISGIVFITAFYYVNRGHATLIFLIVILLGISIGNYAIRFKKSRISKGLYLFERKEILFGYGALWLALGSLIAISFIGLQYLLVIFGFLFISDSLASIVGVTFSKPKLPYNKRKSLAGTLAYLISGFAVSILFVGPVVALFLSIIAAVAESFPYHIDDNFDVAVVIVLAALLII
jgi:dolichol kinase